MTAPRLHEYVVPSSAFPAPPVAGMYFVSKSGGTTFHVARVRKIGGGGKPSFRLIGSRLRSADVPPGAIILPWPKDGPRPKRKDAQDPLASGPRKAASPIITRLAASAEERKRIVQARKLLAMPEFQDVEQIRVANGTVIRSDWIDPEDKNPNRRVARRVHGYKSSDPLDRLDLNKSQTSAARRFRQLYETSQIGLGLGVRDLAAPPTGYGTGTPPSEARVQALERYRELARSVGKSLLEVLIAIVVRGETLKAYAERKRLGVTKASGYFLAAVDAVADHFKNDGVQRSTIVV